MFIRVFHKYHKLFSSPAAAVNPFSFSSWVRYGMVDCLNLLVLVRGGQGGFAKIQGLYTFFLGASLNQLVGGSQDMPML